MNPWIIDVEASGFGPDSYPIEIGLALAPDQRYCSLITPDESWTHWTEEAESYHHISRETLIAHGKSIESVATKINQLLDGGTVYSDGWVVDQPWVIKLFHHCRISMNFRISPLEMILDEIQMEHWHQIKSEITEELGIDRHRASNDALIIQRTYNRTLELSQQSRSSKANQQTG